VMESSSSLSPGSTWTTVSNPPTLQGAMKTLQVPMDAGAGYYRLHMP
jgi:hypothetical protein